MMFSLTNPAFKKKGLRIMKKHYLFTAVLVVMLLLLAVAPVQAAAPQPFYVDKVCGAAGCKIQNAAPPFDVFNGTTVQYENKNYGPDSAGNMHMTAGITLTSSSDSQDTISGIVSWVYHDGVFTGHFSFQSGTGDFAGIHARGEIGLVTWPTNFYFSGDYFFAP
jgi:hypothetical protein